MTDTEIHNCNFEFECPANAAQLEETNDPTVRFCTQCERNVYRCSSAADLAHWSRLGECVLLVLRPSDRPSLSTDDVVRFTSGCLKDLEAVIEDVNDDDKAAKVILNIFGRHVPFWIDQADSQRLIAARRHDCSPLCSGVISTIHSREY